MRKLVISVFLIALVFTTQAQRTQKPVLHGEKWMAVTGNSLAATAGSMIFQQAD